MTLDDIQAEFEKHGRLSRRAIPELRSFLASDDPYTAITVAADTGCFELSQEIAQCLSSEDAMVRWNAAAALFTRFRDKEFAPLCIDLAENDPDEMVKSIALVGLGEVLPLLDHDADRAALATYLLEVVSDENELPELRRSSYEGILAAMDVLPLDRPAAGKLPSIPGEIDWNLVDEFGRKFGALR